MFLAKTKKPNNKEKKSQTTKEQDTKKFLQENAPTRNAIPKSFGENKLLKWEL